MYPPCAVAVTVVQVISPDPNGKSGGWYIFGSAIYQQSSVNHRRAAPRIHSACHMCL